MERRLAERRVQGKWRMSRFPLSQPHSPGEQQLHFANYFESALNRSSCIPRSLRFLVYFTCVIVCLYVRQKRYGSSILFEQHYAQLPAVTFPANTGKKSYAVPFIGLSQIITVPTSWLDGTCSSTPKLLENMFIVLHKGYVEERLPGRLLVCNDRFDRKTREICWRWRT